MFWDLLQLALITVSLVLRDLQMFDSVWLVILYTVRVYGIGVAIHRLYLYNVVVLAQLMMIMKNILHDLGLLKP